MKPLASRLAIISGAGLLGLALIAVVTRSNPRYTVIPANATSVDSVSEAVKRLSPEDRELFAGYFARHLIASRMGGMPGSKAAPIPEGTTIGYAIKEQRAFVTNASIQEAEAINLMRSAVAVTLVSKEIVSVTGSSGVETDRKLQVVFAYRNNTEKAVVGLEGTANVKDLSGAEISGFAISNGRSIAPGATITWTGSRSVEFGANSASAEKLGNLQDDKYRMIWNPKIVVFADGTKLTGPDAG